MGCCDQMMYLTLLLYNRVLSRNVIFEGLLVKLGHLFDNLILSNILF